MLQYIEKFNNEQFLPYWRSFCCLFICPKAPKAEAVLLCWSGITKMMRFWPCLLRFRTACAALQNSPCRFIYNWLRDYRKSFERNSLPNGGEWKEQTIHCPKNAQIQKTIHHIKWTFSLYTMKKFFLFDECFPAFRDFWDSVHWQSSFYRMNVFLHWKIFGTVFIEKVLSIGWMFSCIQRFLGQCTLKKFFLQDECFPAFRDFWDSVHWKSSFYRMNVFPALEDFWDSVHWQSSFYRMNVFLHSEIFGTV
jgi:hypothetical protein